MYNTITINKPKITNGAEIIIGEPDGAISIIVNRHFNWFQKKMIGWCFGFKVKDYTEETTEEATNAAK